MSKKQVRVLSLWSSFLMIFMFCLLSISSIHSNNLLADTSTINNSPVIDVNTGLLLSEGSTEIISSSILLATDIDDTSSELTYTIISEPDYGRLEFSDNPGVAITSYTQADIDTSRLVYVHDGSEPIQIDISGFSAEFELSSLLAANGGDGSSGFAINGVKSFNNSGVSVANAGDVNGDGYDDVLIGSLDTDPFGGEVGETYLLFGQPQGFSAEFELSSLLEANGGDGTAGFVLHGIDEDDESGYAVSTAGDINGDGYDDLLIGARSATPNGFNSGESYLVFGKPIGFPAEFELSSLLVANGGDGSAGFVLNGIDAADRSGYSVSSAGDVNGDGYDDLLIGAWGADPNGNFSGETYVLFGKATGFSAEFELSSLLAVNGGDGSDGFVINGISAFDWSGYSVSSAGDFNGDGHADIIIGANSASPNGPQSGETYVVLGKATGFSAEFELSSLLAINGGDGSAGFILNGIDENDGTGNSVSGAGDINGDGYDDLIIGASNASPNGNNSGKVYVVFGSAVSLPAEFELSSLLSVNGGDGNDGFVINGIAAFDNSGHFVSDAGDVNGDGYADILIGADGADPNSNNAAGASYIIYGKA